MRSALDVHRELLARDVPHEVVRLRTRLLTADDLPRALDLEPSGSSGCVTVRCYLVERSSGSSVAAVLVPSGMVPSPLALLEALDACSVRPARPEQVNEATDYADGLVSPLCLPEGVELLADAALGAHDVSYCALGEGGVALGIRTRDLLVASGARVASLTGAPHTAAPRTAPSHTAASHTRVAGTDGEVAGAGSVLRPDGEPGPRSADRAPSRSAAADVL